MGKVWILAWVLILTGLAQAQSVPGFVNYQGRLTDEGGAPLATGDYALRFEVYNDPVAGSRVWGPLCFDLETGLTPSDGHKFKVPVVQGYFNVVLDRDNGYTDCTDTTPDGDGMAAPVSAAFVGAPRYVEVAVWNETGSAWEPILPRQQVLSAPYAVSAVSAVSADRSSEVVSAEGLPTRIACKTGPTTEVDVVTIDDGTVDVHGDLAVSGELTVSGDGHLTILEDPAVLVSRTAISSVSGCPGANQAGSCVIHNDTATTDGLLVATIDLDAENVVAWIWGDTDSSAPFKAGAAVTRVYGQDWPTQVNSLSLPVKAGESRYVEYEQSSNTNQPGHVYVQVHWWPLSSSP
jgi:hypothetical protein